MYGFENEGSNDVDREKMGEKNKEKVFSFKVLFIFSRRDFGGTNHSIASAKFEDSYQADAILFIFASKAKTR